MKKQWSHLSKKSCAFLLALVDSNWKGRKETDVFLLSEHLEHCLLVLLLAGGVAGDEVLYAAPSSLASGMR